ncbi:hypothetical protein DND132_0194 [Pseudodesulfovibrio mercurii]|uniref:Surface carbohydrate biosynthesis protein n=1 Tax=Pseudodesulfovibrio mercurii TaxID=641491 RepID=F0JDX2_9BACT|nr:surface carbohydrate biosynthesis protein [Pseudodesulfovibrio mercurii]EGB13412.1 hypothetical protein DND132_0194 [Pseudodesulfovibrio mercurii]
MNLYITVEIASRELEAKTFLACCAAQEGFDVYIGAEDMIRRLAVLGEPGILLDKSIHSEYPPLFNFLKRLGHRIAVNDEEGLCINPKQYSLFNLTPAVSESVDMFFAWGSLQRDLMVSRLPDMADRAHVTGNPRLDLLHPRLRKFHERDVRAIHDTFGRFILINTRFTTNNNTIGGEAMKERFLSGKHGPNIEYLMKRYEADEQYFYALIDSLKRLCVRYPSRNFVLRPHPAEKLEPWFELARDYPNLHVVREGNVHKWILASDLMLQNGCTTAIEAFLLGTPCVCYRPVQSELDECLPNKISYHILDFEELCRCVEGELDERIRSKRPEWEKVLAPYAHRSGAELSSPLVLEHLRALARMERAREPFFSLRTRFDARIRHWNRMLKWQIRKMKSQPDKLNPKWPALSLEAFRELANRFVFFDDGFASLEITQAYKDCFRVTRVGKHAA